MKFKALAIDIDGTITYSDRRLHFMAAEHLRNLGIPVVLATGNVLCYAAATSKLIGLGGKVISENGGVISTGFDTKPHISDSMEECEKAFSYLTPRFDLIRLDNDLRKTEIALRRNIDAEVLQSSLERAGFHMEVIDTRFALHIKSRKINKGTGLAKMASLMDLDVSDFVAIGDSANDREMFEVAGYGIAVSNADPDLKSIADYVTSMSFGEGTVEALNILNRKKFL
ncbi:phosphoglycolate phosphatase [Methanohalophilus halophilus]|uniref:Phosphoglycolate phosphatase n=1 Tax=Methanohalophilus halophilus TaxID=2177 RepID=A0A1L3Q0N1_9EURY|nr:phosphoglycolate phosphatase [Methanohalophilus halophilus]APH38427.1 phosphoglycolate phosphatase [Methanohalophilus halophilus]RNI10701.1 phosphoglycolate phosphatase [Methanohalophilus halophilus]SDW07122.1 hypothetical protein SAMN04515625_0279 [Methanohalophilus halophilus]